MPVTIDEMTADVAPAENRGASSDAAPPPPNPPAEQRRQKELLERIHQRAARVRAN
jgi:hypothetical protein